jgi:hypothetical protein
MPAAEHEWELWFELLPRGAWELLEQLDESERAALEKWLSSVHDPTQSPPPEPVRVALEKLERLLSSESC